MKKLILSLFLVLSLLVSPAYAITTYSSLRTAVAAVGSTVKSVLISGSETLSANLTIPSTMEVTFAKGAIITLGVYNLTINGPFNAGMHEVFNINSTGAVSFAAGTVKEVPIVWFLPSGYVTDGSVDYGSKIQATLDAIPTGGALLIPTGKWGTSVALTVSKSMTIYGFGPGSQILTSSATANIFTITGSRILFRDFSVWSSVTKSAGYAFAMTTPQDVVFENVHVGTPADVAADGNRLYKGVYFNGFDQCHWRGGYIYAQNDAVTIIGNGAYKAGLWFNGGFRILSSAKAFYVGGNAGGIYIDEGDVSICEYGIYVDDVLASGTHNREMFLGPLLSIDGTTKQGLYLAANSISTVSINGTWFASGQTSGLGSGMVEVQPSQPADFRLNMIGVKVFNNKLSGIVINDGAAQIVGCDIVNNGLISGGHGILLANTAVNDVLIQGNQIKENGTVTTGYGIQVVSGVDYYSILDNVIESNLQGAIDDSGSAPKMVKNNRGYNPVGDVSPTVPGSTVAYTNAYGQDCMVIVNGGTVTVIAVNGTTTGLTSGTVIVPANATITLTYSVAPTWEWNRN